MRLPLVRICRSSAKNRREEKTYLFNTVARVGDSATVWLFKKIWPIGQISPDQIAHWDLVCITEIMEYWSDQKFQTCFGHLVLALWNFALGEPAEGRIPQGENLRFVCNLVLGVWDFIIPWLFYCSELPGDPKRKGVLSCLDKTPVITVLLPTKPW